MGALSRRALGGGVLKQVVIELDLSMSGGFLSSQAWCIAFYEIVQGQGYCFWWFRCGYVGRYLLHG